MTWHRSLCAWLVGQMFLGTAAPAQAEAGAPPEAARQTFQDARFGLFVPWGVYSLLGKGPWVMERDRLPISEYEKLPPRFNPVEFDAEAWVKMARGAGAKYLVVAAKHHDGFCLFDSKLTRYDVVDATPYARDPLKALADACRKQGLLLCVYYSLLDWHHPDYVPRGETGKSAGRDDKGDWSRYLAYSQGQVRELCSNYGPIGGVWLDGAWDRPDADWDLDATYALIRKLQPRALVANGRKGAGAADRPGEDVQWFERELPGGAAKGPAPVREVSLGLSASQGPQVETSTEEVVRLLVDLAGRGSNLRLGVGPKPDGAFPGEVVDRLAGIGRWLERHGETVYGTRPGPIPPQRWGVSTQQGGGGGRPMAVYLHVLKPEREIRLPEVSLSFDARPLGTTQLLKQEQDGKEVVISLPEPGPAGPDTVIVLTPRLLDPPQQSRR